MHFPAVIISGVADLEVARLRRRDRREKLAIGLEIQQRCAVHTIEPANEHDGPLYANEQRY